jgi:cell division septation protein DedD
LPEYVHNRHNDESEGFFCRFTFGQFFALLVLEVFTLFFIFYLGARYGRGLLGLDRPPELAAAAAVEEQVAPGLEVKEAAPAQRVSSTSDPEVQKIAQDLIAKAETPELKDRIRKMIDEAQQGRAQQMPEVISVDRGRAPEGDQAAALPTSAQQAVAQAELPPAAEEPQRDVAEEQGPAAMPMPARREALPARAPAEELAAAAPQPRRDAAQAPARQPTEETGAIRIKSSEKGRYSLQVGSYPERAEAAQRVETWKGKGYPAYLTVADIPGRGRWYRVRIGGFGTREEAARYLNEFSSRESANALVVMSEQ